MTKNDYRRLVRHPFLLASAVALAILAAAMIMTSRSYAVPANSSFPSFATQHQLNDASSQTSSVAIGDLDNDNHNDIILGEDGGQNLIFRNNGDGSFGNPQPLGLGSNATQVMMIANVLDTATLTGNDIAIANYGGQSLVYLGDGSGDFANIPSACDNNPRVRCFGGPTDLTYQMVVAD